MPGPLFYELLFKLGISMEENFLASLQAANRPQTSVAIDLIGYFTRRNNLTKVNEITEQLVTPRAWARREPTDSGYLLQVFEKLKIGGAMQYETAVKALANFFNVAPYLPNGKTSLVEKAVALVQLAEFLDLIPQLEAALTD